MNVYEIPGGGLISVCFSSLSYHLNVTPSLSVACHSLISIQYLACWSHYLRWMYQTRGLLLWGSFSSDSNAGLGLASDWLFRGESYLGVSERHSSSKYLPLCVFPTGTEHTAPNLEGARTILKLSAPSEDAGLHLYLNYEISSSSGKPGPIVLLPVVASQPLCMVK